VVLLAVGVAMLAMASVADAAIVGSKPIKTWQANGTVRVEVIRGNIVYLGGSFTAMLPAGSTGSGAVTRNGVAAINLDTGALLSWNPNVTGGTVYALEPSGSSNMYIGGGFAQVGGANHKKIVEVSTSGTGAVVTAFKPPTPNKTVHGITLAGSDLYIGGAFTKMGGANKAYAAKVNATTGALNSTWSPVVDNEVHAIAVNGTRAVLGGFFRNLNGASFIGIGAVDTNTGATLPWAWHTSDLQTFRPFQVLRFTQDGSTLFAAGTGNGGELLSFNFADGTLNWVSGVNGNVTDMAVLDGFVYYGGHFSGYCGMVPGNNFCTVQASRDKLVAVDEGTGALQSWHPAVNTSLGMEAMAAGDGSLTIGGQFTKAGGVAQQHFAQFKE
jgi:hypothetical protein